MGRASVGDVELEYETFGSPDDPTLLLIMGFTAQLTSWNPEFCRQLADAGFHVVIFDNRDCGLSSRLPGEPDLDALLTGDGSSAPYTLDDMAADAVGLLDVLGVARAHVVGVSMGGMIAQLVAINHPERTASLCSIMSTTGAPDVGWPSPEGLEVLTAPAAPDREGAAEQAVVMSRVSIPDVHRDEDDVRRRALSDYDRGHDPAANQRQLAAIVASSDRTAALGTVTAPTLVIHGLVDTLIGASGGEATAAAVADAKHVTFADMGHFLPAVHFPALVDAITENARRSAH